MNATLVKLKEWGCDIDGALPRFLEDEEFMLECIVQTADDPAFPALLGALERSDVKGAFDAAHTLKGVLANTGLTPLYNTVVRFVEPLRAGKCEGLPELWPALERQRLHLRELLGLQ